MKSIVEPSLLDQIYRKYNVLGLSETRWNSTGEHTIVEGDLLISSSKPEGERREDGGQNGNQLQVLKPN